VKVKHDRGMKNLHGSFRDNIFTKLVGVADKVTQCPSSIGLGFVFLC